MLDRLYQLLEQHSGITRKRDRRLEHIARDRAVEARYVVGLVTDGNDGIPHPVEQLMARTFPMQGAFKGVWENCAWSYGYADPIQRLADGWWNSAPHRANLMNADATTWGIGHYTETPADGVTRHYAVTIFTKDLLMPPAIVVNGLNYPDALAASKLEGPILFVTKSAIPKVTRDRLVELKPSEIIVVGGTAVVDASVATALSTIAPVRRIAGADRYSTAVEVSKA